MAFGPYLSLAAVELILLSGAFPRLALAADRQLYGPFSYLFGWLLG
jgi:hypothetical protein